MTLRQNIMLTSADIHTKQCGSCSFQILECFFSFPALVALCKGAQGLVYAFSTHSSAVILSKLYMKRLRHAENGFNARGALSRHIARVQPSAVTLKEPYMD